VLGENVYLFFLCVVKLIAKRSSDALEEIVDAKHVTRIDDVKFLDELLSLEFYRGCANECIFVVYRTRSFSWIRKKNCKFNNP
jgi:hypothetical protein